MLNLLAEAATNTTTTTSTWGYGFIFYIVQAVSLMVLAKKAGVSNGWFGWIPILNFVLMAKIAEVPVVALLLGLFPCFTPFVYGYLWWRIAEKQGKPGWLGIVSVIPILQLFVPPYLAFSD